MTMIILMKGDIYVCGEGIGADKGVLAQKTELPGIYPSLLLLLMMMMMTMMVMIMMVMMIVMVRMMVVMMIKDNSVFEL